MAFPLFLLVPAIPVNYLMGYCHGGCVCNFCTSFVTYARKCSPLKYQNKYIKLLASHINYILAGMTDIQNLITKSVFRNRNIFLSAYLSANAYF